MLGRRRRLGVEVVSKLNAAHGREDLHLLEWEVVLPQLLRDGAADQGEHNRLRGGGSH